jgi:[acyl-carrier-protein] S-malonyltransferase
MLDALPSAALPQALLDLAEDLAGLPMRRIAAEGPDSSLADTRVAQPLLFISGLAWAHVAESSGVQPCAVAGHSLGELTALVYAGVLDPDDGIRLVSERARLMAEAAAAIPGTMAAVLGMSSEEVAGIIGGLAGVWVGNENGPGQVTISGTHPGVEHASAALLAAGARVVPLRVSGAFHSPLMADAAAEFRRLLEAVSFRDARLPLAQNTDPSLTTAGAVIKERLSRQMVSPVGWTAIMEGFRAEGIGVLAECGPGSVLTGITRRMEGLEGVSLETDGVDRLREVVLGCTVSRGASRS